MHCKLATPFLALPLLGCSANPLLSTAHEQFLVDSVPVGASVRVLGEPRGQTPMSLSTDDVFPRDFDYDKQHLYGRIELTYPGCEPFVTTVSSRIIRTGLTARLQCGEPDTSHTPAPSPRQEEGELTRRLRQLKELYEEGLISQEEYDGKRQQLLNEL